LMSTFHYLSLEQGQNAKCLLKEILIGHLFTHFGARFSTKASTPSRKSSV